MCGIGPGHVRVLCETSWEGGREYTPDQVGRLTLDEIFMLLCDRKHLRFSDKNRTTSMGALEAVATSKDGVLRGRAADGTPIKGRVTGKSLARRLAEEAKQKTAKEDRRSRRDRRKALREAAAADVAQTQH